MSFAQYYLQKYSTEKPIIADEVAANVGIIITIPCHREDKVIEALDSLWNCNSTICKTEVIIVVNYSETADKEIADYHLNTFKEVRQWIDNHEHPQLQFYAILQALKAKDAGVGLARKIVMDEAVRRFGQINKPSGVIVGFDADCHCAKNYLTEIEQYFVRHPNANGCSVWFEHPISGADYSLAVYKGITQYELYLRYYLEAMRYIGVPYAFQTLGSSFAVRANAYTRQGGMNKRKAGEDFYFLHKIIALGNFGELNATAVYPSPRPSDRVPFGTGAAINKMIQSASDEYFTFSVRSFVDLKEMIGKVDELYHVEMADINSFLEAIPEPIAHFFISNNFIEALEEINNNSKERSSFRKRFFNWFNGLMVLHFLNESHSRKYQKEKIEIAAAELLKLVSGKEVQLNLYDLLQAYNQRQINYQPQ